VTSPADASPAYVVDAREAPAGPDLRELWAHRQVLRAFFWRNVRRRYRQTLIGPAWFVLGPLVRMVIFSFLLGRLARLPSEGVPYPLFAYAALLPWELFATGSRQGTESLERYMHIVARVWLPRMIVPIAEVLGALVPFACSMVVLFGMLLAFGYAPDPRWLWILPLTALALASAGVVSLALATVQVHYRDVAQLVGYGLQVAFFVTPVVYSGNVLHERAPEVARVVYLLNPLCVVVDGFRWALLDTRPPSLGSVVVACGLVTVGLLWAGRSFQRRIDDAVDVM